MKFRYRLINLWGSLVKVNFSNAVGKRSNVYRFCKVAKVSIIKTIIGIAFNHSVLLLNRKPFICPRIRELVVWEEKEKTRKTESKAIHNQTFKWKAFFFSLCQTQFMKRVTLFCFPVEQRKEKREKNPFTFQLRVEIVW